MGRRKQSAQWDLFKAAVIIAGVLIWLLHSQGLLVPLLLLIFGGIIVALVVVLIVFALKQLEKRPLSNVRPASIPVLSEPADIEVKCPRCEAVLIAPAEMAGEPATCEGCRHVLGIPKSAHKFPDATHFYSPKRSGAFSAALLKELEWKRFEKLVEGYFAKTGWETRPNRPGADGGVDVHLLRPGQPGVAAIVQCKAWQTYNVGVKPVRELFGVMAADHVPEGFFVTTGDYTGDARSFAAGKPMTLIDGADLLRRLAVLSSEHQADLFAMVTAGDYTTPTCPQCGVKMVRRQAGKGRSPGNEFWGCPAYPRCRQTFQMKKDVE